ncbi:MAG: cation diffusion facilitator family transporter [Sulfurimonadaceae bacterium]|nr:cation diffusion facilitator family transporter [Sulfurimonadaceae bacterium]
MRIEKKATVISTTVASFLVIIKMAIGLISGSVAVLASAIDSLLDVSVSLFNFFALHNAEKAPDSRFNYGRSKLEPLAAVVEGTIISLSGLFIFYQAIEKMWYGQKTTYLEESIGVMFISIVITAALVMFLQYVAKKTGNMVIKADALHYKTDLFSNGAVLFALGLISITGEDIIDPILGIVIAGYMIYSAYPLIKEGVLMLLDVALEPEEVEKIEAILKSHMDNQNITDYHYLQTRQAGSVVFVSVHLVYTISISLYDAHKVGDEIEMEIKKLFPEKSVEAIVHMDPYDDEEINEAEAGLN